MQIYIHNFLNEKKNVYKNLRYVMNVTIFNCISYSVKIYTYMSFVSVLTKKKHMYITKYHHKKCVTNFNF